MVVACVVRICAARDRATVWGLNVTVVDVFRLLAVTSAASTGLLSVMVGPVGPVGV